MLVILNRIEILDVKKCQFKKPEAPIANWYNCQRVNSRTKRSNLFFLVLLFITVLSITILLITERRIIMNTVNPI